MNASIIARIYDNIARTSTTNTDLARLIVKENPPPEHQTKLKPHCLLAHSSA